MNNGITLNELELENIRKLARDERQALGFVGETPIANDTFTIIENLNIKLLEYPIESEGDKPAFSAALMYSEEGGEELIFIGLNTADYFDKQIFALSHELYHFYTKTGSHLSRLEDEENNLIEAKANRFAAEFLLPESVLESTVLTEFKTSSLQELQIKTLLRFIARLQCTWWLPYRSLVKRLKEIHAISDEQYTQLYSIDERNLNGEYGRLGKAINKEIFLKLNTRTSNIGISPKDIEVIIRNFEDSIIDEDKFADTLNLFHKTPDDFGYEFTISEEDMDQFEEFFKEESDNES
jgi:Zn-dependent peptidase ImmA (M78 family)